MNAIRHDDRHRRIPSSGWDREGEAIRRHCDRDGNYSSSRRWHDTWGAENHLVKLAVRTGVRPQISLPFDYDHQGRRLRQRVWNNKTWSGSPTHDVRCVYDGWNLLASLNPPSSVRQAYLCGLDLSGNLQAAGGVGGLLAITDASQGSHFCAYDGNGNVTALVKASDGTLAAQYAYGPFGELLRATGPMAKANPFRFSTKYQDDETDLLYYGYRYYDPDTGRWPNRDPLEEQGGVNLYGFVYNNSISAIDTDGRFFAPPEVRALRRPWWWRRNVEVRLPESPLRIYVEKCEIVILIGEGYYTDENGKFRVLPRVWNMPRTCAYAAFLGCFAKQNNDATPRGKLFPSELLDSEEYKRGISRVSSAFKIALAKLQEVERSRAKEMLTTGKGVCNCCKVDIVITADQ